MPEPHLHQPTTSPSLEVIIRTDGNCVTIYDEQLPLGTIGSLRIARASHVEPDLSGSWQADLSPVGGPVFGPFPLRSQALAAERAWLNRHLHQLPHCGLTQLG
jgi:hypothetical protein